MPVVIVELREEATRRREKATQPRKAADWRPPLLVVQRPALATLLLEALLARPACPP